MKFTNRRQKWNAAKKARAQKRARANSPSPKAIGQVDSLMWKGQKLEEMPDSELIATRMELEDMLPYRLVKGIEAILEHRRGFPVQTENSSKPRQLALALKNPKMTRKVVSEKLKYKYLISIRSFLSYKARMQQRGAGGRFVKIV